MIFCVKHCVKTHSFAFNRKVLGLSGKNDCKKRKTIIAFKGNNFCE